ncbi:uncharacterized protein LOC111100805 [Crassostrea virginica]|uniref:Uncharacterized protein LOC111100805 n=1 Tax=Crassostrea virginica TaxID=6565 RepID=A0A8B8ABT2_CRAVI|nr:uncharacterized protein LOC111100805 [Crassostrea virginica]
MILSSVNFVKTNSRQQKSHFDFSDFIIGKIKEEQDQRDGCNKCGSPAQHAKKNDGGSKSPARSSYSESVRRRSSTQKDVNCSNVTVETKDGYVVSLCEELSRIYLGDVEDPNNSNIFRQTKHTLQDGDSSQEFYSFRLHSRGHLFLSVTPDRQLAVQQSDTPVDPQAPDDRCFVMHSVSNGSVFIQPYHHKGYYLHHLDKTLTVSKLEINWRPPEEYFFSVGVVDVPDPEVFLPREDVPVKKPSPFIEESSPVKPSLLWGCFGGKSKKFSSKIKKTIKHTSRV